MVHNGYAFGFDGSILACIDLKDGNRKWKGGRYGNGQLILLPDQDVMIVLSEEGELALVGATPNQFTELARFPAHRGQNLEPPRAGRRRPAGSQRPGNGRVQAGPGKSLIGARPYCTCTVVVSAILADESPIIRLTGSVSTRRSAVLHPSKPAAKPAEDLHRLCLVGLQGYALESRELFARTLHLRAQMPHIKLHDFVARSAAGIRYIYADVHRAVFGDLR